MTRRYWAHFDAQTWFNGYAVPCDPQGPEDWDCTAFVTNPPDRHRHGRRPFNEDVVLAGIKQYGCWLDEDDALKEDPTAPKWILEWEGPFTITVELREPIDENQMYHLAKDALELGEISTTDGVAGLIRALLDELEGSVPDDLLRPVSRSLDRLLAHAVAQPAPLLMDDDEED